MAETTATVLRDEDYDALKLSLQGNVIADARRVVEWCRQYSIYRDPQSCDILIQSLAAKIAASDRTLADYRRTTPKE